MGWEGEGDAFPTELIGVNWIFTVPGSTLTDRFLSTMSAGGMGSLWCLIIFGIGRLVFFHESLQPSLDL